MRGFSFPTTRTCLPNATSSSRATTSGRCSSTSATSFEPSRWFSFGTNALPTTSCVRISWISSEAKGRMRIWCGKSISTIPIRRPTRSLRTTFAVQGGQFDQPARGRPIVFLRIVLLRTGRKSGVAVYQDRIRRTQLLFVQRRTVPHSHRHGRGHVRARRMGGPPQP